ncbi:hypothetical protein F5Y16DRAFT_416093 [Xylariaceae sp. FL0255]|nr:hypothetical protein F5Y16DRAFT_416093 [Xylariaceae sp. FL0255]
MSRYFSEIGQTGTLSDATLKWTAHYYARVRIHEVMFTRDRKFYAFVNDDFDVHGRYAFLPGGIVKSTVPSVGIISRTSVALDWAGPLPWRKSAPESHENPNIRLDTSRYVTLKPGVMLKSNFKDHHGVEKPYASSSGILVQDLEGTCFMTAATHAIGEDGTLWQPNRPHKPTGKAVFWNVPFANSNGVTPIFSHLLSVSEVLTFWPILNLNSTFTSNMEAIMTAKSVRVLHCNESHTEPRYVNYNWAYTGQLDDHPRAEDIIPHEGTSGSAIWTDDRAIYGFFEYYIKDRQWKGHSTSVSPSVLADEDLSLGYSNHAIEDTDDEIGNDLGNDTDDSNDP